MPKIKRFQLKAGSWKASSLSQSFVLALLSAVIIMLTAISLPFTEEISESFNYDLNLKENQYYAKSYILELTVKDADTDKTAQKLNETKDVLETRLNKYGVEIVKITDYEKEEDAVTDETSDTNSEVDLGTDTSLTDSVVENNNKEYLRVTVETTKDPVYVDTLVRSRNYMRLVTQKEAVDFANSEDALAQYLPENYDFTPFTLRSFRKIFITELQTTTGDSAYFSVYKAKLTQSSAFKDFLSKYAGQTIGISIDGFVTPYNVPLDFASDVPRSRQAPVFAPSIAQVEEDAKLANILFNSGVIPLEYEVIEEADIPTSVVKPDYPTVLFAIASAIVGVVLLIGWRNKEESNRNIIFVSATGFTFITWLAYLKFYNIPVDLDIIVFSGFTVVFLLKLFTYRLHSRWKFEMTVVFITLIAYFLSSGYLKLYTGHMFGLSVLAIASIYIMQYYINNMKKMLQK